MNRGELYVYIELYKRKEYDKIPVGKYTDGKYFYMTNKQVRALELLNDDVTTSIGYGGAARSGKTLIECVAIIFDCLAYPGIAWGLARKELTTLTKTVLVTLYAQFEFYGLEEKEDYEHNNKYNYIEFKNSSKIWLIDTKTKPTDPLNTRFGGLELTRSAIDESNETDRSVIVKLFERTGWKNNEKYGLKRKQFECFNPDKKHVYSRYYLPWKKGEEKDYTRFIQALPTDNPNPAVKEWVKDMLKTADKITIERQIYGNFEYDDNPYALCDYDNILAIFENNQIDAGNKYYLTADIARFGSDHARIGVWKGWELVEVKSYDISAQTEIQACIMFFRKKYNIAAMNCIADEDGIGGGVVDNCRIRGFKNNSRPFKENVSNKMEIPEYVNLQTQCIYHLADKINKNEIYISADLSEEDKDRIAEELGTIEQEPKGGNKLKLTSKEYIKSQKGWSPDWRDMLMMRSYYDYHKTGGFKID